MGKYHDSKLILLMGEILSLIFLQIRHATEVRKYIGMYME